jgi:mannose-6-phosphate isomerase
MHEYLMPIIGVVQHYAWGGTQFIPTLIGQNNPENKPFAEYWMGAHPSAPSCLRGYSHFLLDDIVEKRPAVLGERVVAQFGGKLPFLFKVLDVKKMLSIQVHPNKKQAIAGFAKENALNIPLSAPHRNFKDDNHKPEIMVALTDFYLLHGFQSKKNIANTLASVPEFSALQPHFAEQNTRKLYQYIMEMPQAEVNQLLAPLKTRLFQANTSNKKNPDYWAKTAFVDYTTLSGDFDRGIFSIYLLNLVFIKKGDGIFQDAGIPHAYLEGVNMELMANSDNVFRGGLTPKHIDVSILLKHTKFAAVTPKILSGAGGSHITYKTPAPDFELSKIELPYTITYDGAQQPAPRILIVLHGEVEVITNRGNLTFNQGETFFVPANVDFEMKAKVAKTVLFQAGVPI